MELKAIKSIFHKELSELYPKEEIDSFFYLMIEHHLNLERFILALQPNYVVSKSEEQDLFEGLSRLRKHEPIQYILGQTQFYGMRFNVNSSVLIPRPETEELVQWIIDTRRDSIEDCNILDIGTGSGCIAISLAKNLPGSEVYAMEVSEKALVVARENGILNDVDVNFIEANIKDSLSFNVLFDIIVSNPPYVRTSEQQLMKSNVIEYEPHIALFVANDDPLVFYRHIVEFAQKNLKENGLLFLEVNEHLASGTQKLLEDQKFSEIELRKDVFGKDRMIKASWHSKE